MLVKLIEAEDGTVQFAVAATVPPEKLTAYFDPVRLGRLIFPASSFSFAILVDRQGFRMTPQALSLLGATAPSRSQL